MILQVYRYLKYPASQVKHIRSLTKTIWHSTKKSHKPLSPTAEPLFCTYCCTKLIEVDAGHQCASQNSAVGRKTVLSSGEMLGEKSPHSLFWTDERPLPGSLHKSTAKNKAIIYRQQQFALAGDGQYDLIVPFISNFYDSVFSSLI